MRHLGNFAKKIYLIQKLKPFFRLFRNNKTKFFWVHVAKNKLPWPELLKTAKQAHRRDIDIKEECRLSDNIFFSSASERRKTRSSSCLLRSKDAREIRDWRTKNLSVKMEAGEVKKFLKIPKKFKKYLLDQQTQEINPPLCENV